MTVTPWAGVRAGAKRPVLPQSRTRPRARGAGLTENFVNIYSRLPPEILLKQFPLPQRKTIYRE